MSIFKGLATGIGSLPHFDADEAVELVFEFCPHLPFWPQLPKRDIRERMLFQFSEGLPALKIAEEGLFFDSTFKDEQLESFYEKIIQEDKNAFAINEPFALGLYRFRDRLRGFSLKQVVAIKGQICGPFTFLGGIKHENGSLILYDPILRQAFLKGLMMKALWQIDFFREFEKPILLFIDEPYLSCFGSAYTSLERDQVLSTLSEFISGIKSENTFFGIHCCGNTDWSLLTELPGLDVISFDAFAYLDNFLLYASQIKEFLERGGYICWGIVPTCSYLELPQESFLVTRLQAGIEALIQKGVDERILKERVFFSPACGLGTLSKNDAAAIFSLLKEIIKTFDK